MQPNPVSVFERAWGSEYKTGGEALLSGVEKFLRIDDRMSAADIMRARAVYFTAFIVFLTQLANQVSLFITSDGFQVLHLASSAACFVVLALALVLRWTKNFKVLTLGFVAVLMFGVLVAALPAGRLGPSDGINSSMLPILICGTVMCAIMSGWRAPLVFCVVAFGVVWGFYGLSMNYALPDFIITEEVATIQYVRAFQATSALIVSGVITSYFSYRMFGLFADLEDSAAAAVRAQELTAKYLADLSHEIRTPLNGIIGLSDHLSREPMREDQKGQVNIIKDCGEGLLGIINNVLDLSKLDAGMLTLKQEPFDLRQLCQNLAGLHGAIAKQKGVAFNLVYGQNVPARFIGDSGRVRQILNNLLSNAVKFTDTGSVWLIIKGETDEAGHYGLKLYVRDTGVGIAQKELPKVFERFEQIDSHGSDAVKGTGLGMSITQTLVEHMGGAVRVNSAPGKGTVFGVFLKLPVDGIAAKPAAPKPKAA